MSSASASSASASASMQAQAQSFAANKKKGPFCKVCFDSGKDASIYLSHYVKSAPVNGVVICPTLKTNVCSYCRLLGHTTKFCEILQEKNRVLRRDYNMPAKNVIVMAKTIAKKVEPSTNNKSNNKSNNKFNALLSDSDDEEEETNSKSVSKSVPKSVSKSVPTTTTTSPKSGVTGLTGLTGWAAIVAKPKEEPSEKSAIALLTAIAKMRPNDNNKRITTTSTIKQATSGDLIFRRKPFKNLEIIKPKFNWADEVSSSDSDYEEDYEEDCEDDLLYDN